MRYFPGFDSFLLPFLIFVLFFMDGPIAAQRPPNPTTPRPIPGMDTSQPHNFSVDGMVFDADSHTRIDGVKAELRAFTGDTVATAFTTGNGNFEFNNIRAGSYDIVIEQMGYQSTHQRVGIRGSMVGIMLELRSIPRASNVLPGNPTVSRRELSIPHKAHDAMGKGLTQLNGKSDFQGSIKQFERAIQEYPDYYEAYAQMSVAYLHLGNSANSEQALRKSLELSQEGYLDALFWMATLLSNGERFADAEPLARKAVELDPNSWQANSELARALLGLSRTTEAEKSALAAVKLQSDNPLLYLLLANIHDALQNYPALLDDLNNYLKRAPTGPYADQVRRQRAQVQQMLADAQEKPAMPTSPSP